MKRRSDSNHTEQTSKETRVDETIEDDTVSGEPSSSSSPTTSKKIQKKIDKKEALLKFKLDHQSDKEKRCPSCQLTTHARSTSSLCPNKKVKEAICEDDERTEQFVIKTSLSSVCNSQELVYNLNRVVEYTNKVLYVGSLFVNFVFIRMLQENLEIPIIEQSLFSSIFALITGNGRKAPEYLADYFNIFCDLTSLDKNQFKSIGYSSILNIAAKQYETLTRNYMHDTHEQRSIMFFVNVMSDKASIYFCKDLSVSSRKALSHYIYRTKEGTEPSWPSSVPQTEENIKVAEKLLDLWSDYQLSNCNFEKLYSEPHLFFKWFKFISEEFKKKVYITEDVPSKYASKGYVYRKLKEIQFTNYLNRKQFKALQEQTMAAINSDKTFEPGSKLKKLTTQHISVIQTFIDTVKARIKDGTFFPSKFTDPRGCRHFSLAPVYSVQSKALQIDAQAFWKLVKESNVASYRPGKKTDAELTDSYYELFNFSKLGFRTRDSLSTGKKRFSNVITTDGYSICFLFTRAIKKKIRNSSPAEKQPADFSEDVEGNCQVWAIDPGIRDIFTAVDISGRQRKMSLDEYYHLSGFNDASNEREKRKKENMEEYLKISDIKSIKTTNEEEFIEACKERLNIYNTSNTYYNGDRWSAKLRFKCYVKKQKCFDEMCKRLTYGSKKYNKKASTGVKQGKKNKESFIPPPPNDSPKKPIKTVIALGDGAFGNSLRGNKAAPVKAFKKALKQRCGEDLKICMIDEYLTSQICNKCKQRNLENITTAKSKRRVHAVLKCNENTCDMAWNRDIMAAKNILDIFLFASTNDNKRLDVFERNHS